MNGDESPDGESIERLLQHARKAKLLRRAATAYLREVQEDIDLGLIPPQDGGLAYRKALRLELAAIHKYTALLRYVSRLVTHPGENPPKSQSPIEHPPGKAHFRCLCGERLVIGAGFSAYKTLVNINVKTGMLNGDCPTCGLLHSLKEPPSADPGCK